ncbi:MAG: hypothetical protein ACLPN5_02555 [Roseiarcus sp.]
MDHPDRAKPRPVRENTVAYATSKPSNATLIAVALWCSTRPNSNRWTVRIWRIPSVALAAPLLVMRNIDKRFQGAHALAKASLEVGAGEIMALVGQNGAAARDRDGVVGHLPGSDRLLGCDCSSSVSQCSNRASGDPTRIVDSKARASATTRDVNFGPAEPFVLTLLFSPLASMSR